MVGIWGQVTNLLLWASVSYPVKEKGHEADGSSDFPLTPIKLSPSENIRYCKGKLQILKMVDFWFKHSLSLPLIQSCSTIIFFMSSPLPEMPFFTQKTTKCVLGTCNGPYWNLIPGLRTEAPLPLWPFETFWVSKFCCPILLPPMLPKVLQSVVCTSGLVGWEGYMT